MSLYKELSYDNDFDQIKGIQFCIMGPDEIKKRSVAEITKSETFNGNEPVYNGLFDPRMGVIDHNKTCVTCGQKNTFCPGHFGHITLAKPIFYIQFFDIVKKLLNCVCFRCSKLLVDPNSPEVRILESKKISRQKRWDALYKLCLKVKRCGQHTTDGCGARKPTITKDGMLRIAFEWRDLGSEVADNVKKQILMAEDVLQILRRISDRDATILGFHPKYNRPEWMICTVLPVPPPAVRPSVRSDTGQRQEDDLTHKLLSLVKVNKNLQQKIDKQTDKSHNAQIDMMTTMLLQYEAATMIDNTNPSIPTAEQKTGRPMRSLTERLKSKDGRIRGNLMGKRVDFSARSVITPDPNISIDELGVPLKIAMNMTFPEIVTKYNKEELTKLVRNGPDIYPGAKHIKKASTGITKRLKNIDRESIVLEEGDIVERHMRNGDYVLFNRQPSLHKMSMLGHRVRVMPFNTFRLNVLVTPAFNADFDGDEMNMHLPQSHQTMEELKQLAAVPTQIISPRDCKPIISVVQDVCLGLYRLTKSYVRISERQMFNLVMTNLKFDGTFPEPKQILGKAKYWSGQQALSMILPAKINADFNTSQFNETKTEEENKEYVVKIKNGEILSGAFDKDVYQSRTKGIVHSVYNEYGPDETRLLYDHTQKLICDWLVYNGFSVGVSDLIVEPETVSEFGKTIYDMKVKVYDIIKNIFEGKFENNSTFNNHDMFENAVNTILNKANKDVGEKGLMNIRDENNRLINMIKSKSKGNTINVAQMIGCVGQQNVDGRRIPYGFDDRTLPHYTKFDDGPEARGFVENSFIKGLTPQEFFFHAMGGREGLIDTAVQSVTGDTLITIIEDGKACTLAIGDWIDNHLAKADPAEIKIYPDQFNMEYYKFGADKKVYIPTCDMKGNTSWGELTAITRHDPGAKIYEIKTYCGRSVKVVDTKSLIIWNEEKQEFVETKTSDVKIGDFVPTIASLQKCPVETEYVYMDEYFPKTEYIWGTELHNAIDIMHEAQGDKYRVERGWWAETNGNLFTLPYTKKASLQRMTIRSNTVNIKRGSIYPYRATRCHSHMPDKIKLDKDFGIFCGLFIAEGSTCEKSGHVHIANVDKDVKDFVKQWFSKYEITTYETTREMTVGAGHGTTSTIMGHSTLLARFMKKFCGHLAPNKIIPDIAFTAPKEFKIGLLNGYYAGDGCIQDKTITASSVSKKLIDGLQMLCSQIGVFGRITTRQQLTNNLGTKNILPTNIFTINGHWRFIFASQVDCVLQRKHNALQKLTELRPALHRNIEQYNNIVLDKIIEINEINADEVQKVYDVTVPSTLNFAIYNGLVTRDTSETGYLQRKLVKAMEDCKVNYDLSVRNAAGVIIQYLYGEDGMDACKLESQIIPYINMKPAKIKAIYNLVNGVQDFEHVLTKSLYDDLTKTKNKQLLIDRMNTHYTDVMNDRDHIITKVFRNASEISVMYPISFHRILTSMQNMLDAAGAAVPYDLSPLYILDTIDKLCEELCVTKSYKGNRLLKALLRGYLTPKNILTKYRLTKTAFDTVVDQIRYRFFESLVQPSEMVGVVAAQSIGEPATQLVLNTFHMSGISSASQAVRGVPRLNELLSVSKNIKSPIMKIHLLDMYKNNKKECMNIMNNIRTIRFRDIVTSSSIYFDPDDFNTNIPEDQDFINIYHTFVKETNNVSTSPWLLRFEFDRSKLLEYNVDMISLYHVLDNFYDDQISCIMSDDNALNLIMRVKLVLDDNASDDTLTDLKALEHNILENIVIKGIKNIERVALDEKKKSMYNNITKTFDELNEWIIYTAGTNLRDVLNHPVVNAIDTVTNDVNEIYETLGIEAARNALYNEIMDVIQDSIQVNYRHIALLVDVMTNRGTILSVNRHGINRGDIGPLAKCSFEETTDKLIKAGIFAEFDKINGVSANVMLGQIAPCGTGDVQIAMDEEILSQIVDSNTHHINQINEDVSYCNETAFTMQDFDIKQTGIKAKRKQNNDVIIV